MRKSTVRAKMRSYVTLVGSLCVLIILFSNFTVSGNLNRTKLFFNYSQNLSDFYSNVEEMDSAARTYLYDPKSENMDAFLKFYDACEENLNAILQTEDENLQWRIQRLRHMLGYYCKPLNQFIRGDKGTYESYNELYYRRNLITNTAPEYYQYLADFIGAETDFMQRKWNHQRDIQLLLMAGLIVFTFVIAGYYSRDICKPIEVMAKNTQRLKDGNYVFEPVKTTLSEIDILAKSFDEMAASVQNHMNELKKNAQLEQELLQRENENLAMKNLVTEMQLHTLQSQINPHFLFNTLGMVSNSAYLRGDSSTSEMIDKLSECLHYAFDKADKNATLYEEIRLLNNYIYIQNKRFSGRIHMCLDVQPDVPDFSIPAMVFQPLLENAILHGVDDMTEDALIVITIRYINNSYVVISIEDNGKGMAPEKLEELQNELKMGMKNSFNSSGHGIGLRNVYARLKMHFGSNIQFNIESEENCGTIITLSVCVKEGDYEQTIQCSDCGGRED